MTIQKTKKIMLLFIIGLLFLAIDIYANTGINYPKEYKNDKDIVGEYQYYNINAFYGATCTYKLEGFVNVSDDTNSNTDSDFSDTTVPADSQSSEYTTDGVATWNGSAAEFVDDVFFDGFRIDIFNDIIGLALIFIACLSLAKYHSTFRLTCILSIITIVLKLILSALPFIFNGMALCNMALAFGISYLLATIITTFFGTKGFVLLAHDTCCYMERTWINTCWFASMIISVLILLLVWVDLVALSNIFTVALVAVILIMGAIFKRIDEFVARNCIEK